MESYFCSFNILSVAHACHCSTITFAIPGIRAIRRALQQDIRQSKKARKLLAAERIEAEQTRVVMEGVYAEIAEWRRKNPQKYASQKRRYYERLRLKYPDLHAKKLAKQKLERDIMREQNPEKYKEMLDKNRDNVARWRKENPEKLKEYVKKRRLEAKKLSESNALYKEQVRNEQTLAARRWRENNPEQYEEQKRKIREKSKAKTAENRMKKQQMIEEIKRTSQDERVLKRIQNAEYQKQWQEKNPEKYKQRLEMRKAQRAIKKAKENGEISEEILEQERLMKELQMQKREKKLKEKLEAQKMIRNEQVQEDQVRKIIMAKKNTKKLLNKVFDVNALKKLKRAEYERQWAIKNPEKYKLRVEKQRQKRQLQRQHKIESNSPINEQKSLIKDTITIQTQTQKETKNDVSIQTQNKQEIQVSKASSKQIKEEQWRIKYPEIYERMKKKLCEQSKKKAEIKKLMKLESYKQEMTEKEIKQLNNIMYQREWKLRNPEKYAAKIEKQREKQRQIKLKNKSKDNDNNSTGSSVTEGKKKRFLKVQEMDNESIDQKLFSYPQKSMKQLVRGTAKTGMRWAPSMALVGTAVWQGFSPATILILV